MAVKLAVTLLLAGLISASPLTSNHVLHERRLHTHPRWLKNGAVHPDSIFPMRVGLAQANVDKGEEYLLDVSHPESANYAKHWSPQDVVDAFKPTAETERTVRQWLDAHGIGEQRVQLSANRAWLAFDATSAEAEHLLKAKYHQFEDTKTGHLVPACDEYHVPAHVQPHIDYVVPGIQLLATDKAPQAQEKRAVGAPGCPRLSTLAAAAGADDLSTCDQTITPACVRALYSIPTTRAAPNPNNTLGVFESQNQYYYQPDLDKFFANYSPAIPAGTHPLPISIDGGYAGSAPNASTVGGEANLDLMLAYPIVYPQTITLYQSDDAYYGAFPNETYKFGFNTFLDAIDGSYCTFSAFGETGDAPIDPHYPDPHPGGYNGTRQCGAYAPATVFSLSYGGFEGNLPVAYQKRQCLEFLKLGLQGVTFVFASGDGGAADYPAPAGQTSATGCLGPREDIFSPTWPGTCPFVTSVGATKVYPGHSVFGAAPESAVVDPAGHPYSVNFSSGGGFSNVYAVPKYQQDAVAAYFRNHTPPYAAYSGLTDNTSSIGYAGASAAGGVYNRAGRGIPDVAAVGDNIAIYEGGRFVRSGGTSASAPIFAAMINRINDERLARGKRPVGFVNPVLYRRPDVFRDITNGSNPACGTRGFDAVSGWDPVTGLGTPHFPKLLETFLALP